MGLELKIKMILKKKTNPVKSLSWFFSNDDLSLRYFAFLSGFFHNPRTSAVIIEPITIEAMYCNG